MIIEQIIDKDVICQVKKQLHLEKLDVIVHVRTEDNGDQYILIQCGDGRSFIFNRSDNSYFVEKINK